MLLGKITVKMGNSTTNTERGRFLTKDISRAMTAKWCHDMLAFYPAVVNCHDVEIVVEAIGNNYLRSISNRIDFDALNEEFKSFLIERFDKKDEFHIVDVHTEEIPFTEASFKMIYCYKQDDYLIPDSDPHDVTASENIYNVAITSFSGRFLPMIKTVCDITQNSNLALTGDIVDTESKKFMNYLQQYEFEAFSKELIADELKVLKGIKGNTFRPFNKCYKMLVSNRTMILPTVTPIVRELLKKNQLSSKAVYTLDAMVCLECAQNDNNFFSKVGKILNELKGSTLVVMVDIPNQFILTKERHHIETDAIQREAINRNDNNMSKIDTEFFRKMNEYNLLDIDDSLDFSTKPEIIRKVVTMIDKAADKEDSNIEILDALNRTIRDVMRTMNIIFAYTDVMGYQQNFMFDKFYDMMKKQSIGLVELSDASLTNDQLKAFGMSTAMAHYNVYENSKDITAIMKHIEKCVDTIVNERTNQSEKKYDYSSLFGYRYLINNALDYRFSNDASDNEYFKEFKQIKKKALADLEGKTEEEKKAIRKKFGEESSFGAIDDDMVVDSDDNLGFFSDSNFKKKHYNNDKIDGVPLEKMVGLTEIKTQIKEFAAFVKINKIKEENDMKSVAISKHMVFMGSPGTAKTSVATQLAKILHDDGLIPTADVKHVSRDDLVGKYVGWTARLVKEAIESAKGGILFVDEAYALVSSEGGSNSFGIEAINTFVNYMDKADVRDSTIIIFAGYKDEMKHFIDSNPGLKSRIGFYFDFPDYTEDELIEIAKIQADNANYILEDGYYTKLREAIKKVIGQKDFGNGRFVRNVFEKSVLQQSVRLYNMGSDFLDALQNGKNTEYLRTIKEEDFSTRGIDVSSSKKPVGFMGQAALGEMDIADLISGLQNGTIEIEEE